MILHIKRLDLVVFKDASDKIDRPLYMVRDILPLTKGEYSVGIQSVSDLREKDYRTLDLTWYDAQELELATIEQLVHHAGYDARLGLDTVIKQSFRKV